MKAHYNDQPPVLQNQNNGSHLYNYNIQPVVITDESEQEKTSYSCDQVVIWGEPTKRKIKREIIDSEYEADSEKQLINDYLAVQAGIITGNEYQVNYIDFLNRRKAIKDMVNADLSVTVKE